MKRAVIALFLVAAPSLRIAAQVDVEILFRANMNALIQQGTFVPGTNSVVYRGQLNGWGCAAMEDPDSDGIYEVEIQAPGHNIGLGEYKFNIDCIQAGWEDGANRTYEITGGEMDTDGDGFRELTVERFFNDQKIAVKTFNVEVRFQVDMNPQINLGNFFTDFDAVVARGKFNGWECADMVDPEMDGIYELEIQQSNLAEGDHEYKFNINCDEARWEEGDNRVYTVTGNEPDTDGDGFLEINISRPFGDVTKDNILDQAVEVVFSLDMTSAKKALEAGETIQVPGGTIASFKEILTVGVTGPFFGWNWGAFSDQNYLNDAGEDLDEEEGDLIYTGSIILQAGSSNRLVYKYGLNGLDNEAGFQQNHEAVIDDKEAIFFLPVDCFGSANKELSLPFGQVDGAFDCSSETDMVAMVPGDVNADGGRDISDPIAHLVQLFGGGTAPECYRDLKTGELTEAGLMIMDFNGDGRNDISDPIGSLNFQFGGGVPHALGDCTMVDATCEPGCKG